MARRMTGELTGSINKANVKGLDDWKRGDPLAAKKLQQPVTALKALGGVGQAGQQINFGSNLEIRMFKVIRLEKDVVICAFSDGTGNEDEVQEIAVAIPYLCRYTPFNSDQVPAPDLRKERFKYTWTFFKNGLLRYDKRTSIDTENDDDEEIQVITGAYEYGDLIWAVRGITGGTGVWHDEEKTQPVVWLDMNQARYWARSSEDEDEEALTVDSPTP